MTLNVNSATTLLDLYSVMAALIVSIDGRKLIRGGKNSYEQKKDAKARIWNKIWNGGFWFAFFTAALSAYLKMFYQ